MNKEKLYFLDIDDTHCCTLEDRLNDAKLEGLKEITSIEADIDNHMEYVWCSHYGEVSEHSECKKSLCKYYTSKSGRGVCSNRGKLYSHGEEVKFNVI